MGEFIEAEEVLCRKESFFRQRIEGAFAESFDVDVRMLFCDVPDEVRDFAGKQFCCDDEDVLVFGLGHGFCLVMAVGSACDLIRSTSTTGQCKPYVG